MRGVLPAGVAELGELEPARGCLFILGGRVISVLALRALHRDDFAHGIGLLFLTWPATSAGKQLAR